jgi:molybdopterin molybdotransferase
LRLAESKDLRLSFNGFLIQGTTIHLMPAPQPSARLPSAPLPSYDEAAALVAACAAQIPAPAVIERVALAAAAGRVMAAPLAADRDQPPFARSTRDGYACRAAEASAHLRLRVAGMTRAGQPPARPLADGAAWEIMTGAPVPAGADAVMMLEHVESGDGFVRLVPPRTVAAGENIVAQGAQARAGQELLAAGTVIGYAQIALAASLGAAALEVYARPRVAILATGDEIVPVEADPAPGQIRNSNAPMLAALVRAHGGEPWVLPAAADSPEALDAAFDTIFAPAARADLLLITGGVSAGKFDLVEPALLSRGARFHFTGARIQPGKPVVFGEIPRSGTESNQDRDGTTFCCGLPGNPVSSAVTFLLFAAPLLAALAGRVDCGPHFALARLKETVKSKGGLTRFLPAACTFGAAGGFPEVARVEWQGSGDLAALARSNCFLVAPEASETLDAGDLVRILPA